MLNNKAKEILNEMDLTGCPWVKDNIIFLTLAGSRSYGTHHRESDYDYRGICIPPADYFLGLKTFEQAECKRTDTTIFGIKKFIKLLIDCNPNIIELLFTDEENIIYKHPIMDTLLKDRKFWLSKKAKRTFLGYATSQLKRIEGHKKWIDSPPTEPSLLEDTQGVLFTKDRTNALRIFSDEELKEMGVLPFHVHVLRLFQKYYAEMQNWKNYKQWRDNRNESRAKLEAAAGYDTKHAMHLMRLLRMAKEIAKDGNIKVKRPDAEFLKDIRGGVYSYPWLMDHSRRLEDQVVEAFEDSILKDKVEVQEASNVLRSMVVRFHNLGIGMEPQGVW